jgi:hypothetical protein
MCYSFHCFLTIEVMLSTFFWSAVYKRFWLHTFGLLMAHNLEEICGS